MLNARSDSRFVQHTGVDGYSYGWFHTLKIQLLCGGIFVWIKASLYYGVLESEYFAEFLVAHVGKPCLAGVHGHVGDGPLGLEQRVDFFFEGALGDEPVDLDVFCLADSEGAVCSLGFDGGVPPEIVVDDLGGCGEVEAGAARLERQDEDFAVGILLEVENHCGALGLGAAAVVEVREESEFLFDGCFEERSHLCKLRKDECLFALFLDALEQVQKHL